MKNIHLIFIFLLSGILISTASHGQTSWKGTVSSSWNTAANWTSGVPSSGVNVIIGDENFTGSYQPSISTPSACSSLTVGGEKAATLTIGKNLTVAGALTITSNGTVSHGKGSVTLSGNLSNSGTYTTTSNNASMNFSGTAQTISGAVTSTFRKMTINTGSVVTLAANITVSGNGSQLLVNGTLQPGGSPTFQATVTTLVVNPNGVLKVNAATFAANYSASNVILNAGSIVEYSATAVNQTISHTLTYATLRISGSGIKSLSGNLPALNSSNASEGNIYVNAGTLDLGAYTANRGTSVAGGTISVANGAVLKIGGTNSFPVNYAGNTLSLTSTVEYSGANQTVSAKTYGNLTLSSSGGTALKTMPATALTIAGNLTSTLGHGHCGKFYSSFGCFSKR
ncbi:hypothetical protein [Niastella populi]|uniref:G8 domain-containing protein n=1 Tax=Niastella populi TaxID=550983 RepID=A0A1V9G230_9BACT|nr:hypothetical protein [Niastella populi]OQP64526.1 hypothetical protein A4R26_15855 [Niastella populi]